MPLSREFRLRGADTPLDGREQSVHYLPEEVGVENLGGRGCSWTKFLRHYPLWAFPWVLIEGEQQLFPGLGSPHGRTEEGASLLSVGGRDPSDVTAMPGTHEDSSGLDGGVP